MADPTSLPVLKVALVEDHEIVAFGFAELLRGYPDIDVVTVAATVPDLDLLATPVDLVVLDLRLGDGSSAGPILWSGRFLLKSPGVKPPTMTAVWMPVAKLLCLLGDRSSSPVPDSI